MTAALVLFPGAGSGRDQPGLLAVEAALAPAGIAVDRVDFPYRRAGRKAPDRPPVLLATVQEAAEAAATRLGVAQHEVALGGRSMGGRIASMAVADGLAAAALVLIAYPLRPPGRPDKLVERTQHLARLTVPCLFVSGTRDPFGRPEVLEAATAAIPGPVVLHRVEGRGHDLKGADAEVAAVVSRWLAEAVAPRPPG